MATRIPPYPMIWDEISEGRIIPFLGAGASLVSRKPKTKWDKKDSDFLPSAYELSEFLAHYSGYPEDEVDKNLSKVASYVELSGGRVVLTKKLSEIFQHSYNPGPVHEFLASIDGLPMIITTNYDDLIECAFREADKPYHLVSYPIDKKDAQGSILWWKPGENNPTPYPPGRLPLTVGDTTIIYKMHGSIDRDHVQNDSFLITEEDYIEFLSRMTEKSAIPPQFKRSFATSRFLFLGYGLNDWNLRVMLRNIRKNVLSKTSYELNEDCKSWAIQRKPSLLDQELWSKRYVDIFDVEISEFIDKMNGNRP